MIPSTFDYTAPSSLDEALKLLHDLGDDAKILAGGHSLIPMMKLRFAEPEHLIDLNNIPGLSYLKIEGGMLKIGAMTREVETEESAGSRCPFPHIRGCGQAHRRSSSEKFWYLGRQFSTR